MGNRTQGGIVVKVNRTSKYLNEKFNIDEKVLSYVEKKEIEVRAEFENVDDIAAYNQYKVLSAFQECKVSDIHFGWNTGYGYDDMGRMVTEKVYSHIFHTENALVRTNIVNGTHALSIALMGCLRPEDELIYCTGGPYSTLEEVIGIRGEGMGSLLDYGVKYNQIELLEDGNIDLQKLRNSINSKTKMVCMQRATGYSWRKAITISQIEEVASLIHNIDSNIIVMVDNCYGEFLDIQEPTDVGVDIMAGSLIKNPGGGIALNGGYIVGKKDLIEKASYRMTCPGIGSECGLTFGQTRGILQGLFMAPKTVSNTIKGAMLCGKVYADLGFEVCPKEGELRSDIIQAIKLEKEDRMLEFCRGVQEAAPIDSHVVPLPWDMPGYEDKVIMAAGSFVQGSSIELSADGPTKEPYIVYFQGGLTYEHSKFGVIKSLDNLYKSGNVII